MSQTATLSYAGVTGVTFTTVIEEPTDVAARGAEALLRAAFGAAAVAVACLVAGAATVVGFAAYLFGAISAA